MSYEGYVQNLCKNGHHWEAEGGSYADPTVCPECTQPPEWVNPVNDTNCDSIGEIDYVSVSWRKVSYHTNATYVVLLNGSINRSLYI